MKNTHNSHQRLDYLKEQLPLEITRAVAETIKEDLGGTLDPAADITASLIPADAINSATIITREHGVFCGKAWADEVFKQLGGEVTIEWNVEDGDKVEPNQTLCTLTGPARALLTGERNAMNFIQTLSGCATATAIYADKIKHTECRLLDTRKTIPGLRRAQKYAVLCGHCFNHRIGLYDAFLIKENHIAACGSIKKAIAAARELKPNVHVEVEVENMDELQQALEAQVDTVMLDNFSLELMQQAVAVTGGKSKLEASGGINENSLLPIAETGVDYISIGALTKDCKAIDLSMRITDVSS